MIESMPTKRERHKESKNASTRERRTSISNQSSNLWCVGHVLWCIAESLMVVESLRERGRELELQMDDAISLSRSRSRSHNHAH